VEKPALNVAGERFAWFSAVVWRCSCVLCHCLRCKN